MKSDCIEAATKEQLGHVRAFLNHNEALLEKSPSEWPVAHTFLQLALQEPDKVFAHARSAPGERALCALHSALARSMCAPAVANATPTVGLEPTTIRLRA